MPLPPERWPSSCKAPHNWLTMAQLIELIAPEAPNCDIPGLRMWIEHNAGLSGRTFRTRDRSRRFQRHFPPEEGRRLAALYQDHRAAMFRILARTTSITRTRIP
jgi:hypothetical protein